MIKPTPGRIVWYRVNNNDDLVTIGDQPLAAMIAGVVNDEMVHLTVSDAFGETHSRQAVRLIQEGEPIPVGVYCEWMPYQKAVAKGEITPTRHAAPGAH